MRSRRKLILFVVFFALVTTGAIFIDYAASPFASVESESGSVAGQALVKSDPQASSGQYVQFGSRSSANFSISGTQILDPTGKLFIPVGVNLLGPDSWWNTQTSGLSTLVKNDWHLNTIRLNSCLPGGCPNAIASGGQDWTVNNNLPGIVNEYTGDSIVTILALHQNTPGQYPGDGLTGDPTLASEISWWTNIANTYKNNPFVWFDLMNEPGNGSPISSLYLSDYTSIIDAIRGTGANNMIVVEGTQWGQDAGAWDANNISVANSAIMTFGPQLAAKYKDIVFSVHIYDQWGINTNSTTTDTERDARLSDYISRVHTLNLPLFIGETGGYGNNGGPAYGQPVDTKTLGTQSAYRVAPGLGVGILAWHGQPGDGFNLVTQGLISNINDPSNPTDLTWSGQLLWNLSRNTTWASL
jgi:mannan endo-1,4-beta-mannosidase